MAGKIARENGKLWHCLVGTYFTYPIRYLIYNETIWMSTMLLEGALAFYHFSKESKPKPLVRRPLRQRSMKWRFVPLAAGVCIYLFVWCAYGDKNSASYGGDEPIYEALYDSFNSWRKDLTRTLSYTWKYTQHYGLYETYQQIVNPPKAKGKQHAFKVKRATKEDRLLCPKLLFHATSFRFLDCCQRQRKPTSQPLGEHCPRSIIPIK